MENLLPNYVRRPTELNTLVGEMADGEIRGREAQNDVRNIPATSVTIL